MKEDRELLHQYARERSQAAFAELVQRHLGRVYAVALRRVGGDVPLAEEVVQTVFAGLARKAAVLARRESTAGWLFVACRYASVDAIRRERRRLRLHEELEAMSSVPTGPNDRSDPEGLRPLLDEAIFRLKSVDREAVLLRFYEERSYADVGVKLRIGENAARMRVERALEKLRLSLARMGVTSTATALTAALSAQTASVAVPSGLAASVLNTAVVQASCSAVLAAVQFMTINKPALVAASLALALTGTGVYQTWNYHRMERQLKAQLKDLAQKDQSEIRKLAAECDQMRSRAEQAEHAATSPTSSAVDATAREIATKVGLLKSLMSRSPGERIPEMKLLHDGDWAAVVIRNPLETENDYRKALADLRGIAKEAFGQTMQAALRSYLKDSQGQLPSDISQLAPYFETPVDDSMLQRYEVFPYPSWGSGSPGIRDKLSSVIDDNYETLIHVGTDGGLSSSSVGGEMTVSLAYAAIDAGIAYSAANGGKKTKDPLQAIPYFANPNDGQKYLQMMAKLRP